MIKINIEKCIGCGRCSKDCITKDFEVKNGKAEVKNISCLKCGHCIAVCPVNAISMDDYDMEEVLDYNKDTFEIEPDHMLNFIKFRRSVRHFIDKPVEDDKILKIIEAGRFTATGSNTQNVSYIVVTESIPSLRTMALKTLSDSSSFTSNQANPNPLALYYAQKFKSMYESELEAPGENDTLFYNAPALILITADSPVNAALAASNMELMAVSLGLGVFYCGFFTRAAQHSSEIKNFVGLKENHNIDVCLVLGYPDVTYYRTVPRKQAEIRWM